METPVLTILASVFAIGLRVGGLMTFAPFFSHTAITHRTRIALTGVLTLILYPIVGNQDLPAGLAGWAGIVGHETMIGLGIGMTLRFVFEGMQLAGQVLGFQLGFSLVNVIDPQTQVDTPLLAIFTQLVSMLIFLQLEIHHWVLRGLGKSFEYLPVGAEMLPGAVSSLITGAGGIFVIAVQVAAPIIVATFLADIAVGFLAKASPQLPVLFLAIPVKSLLGYAVIIGAAPFWVGTAERYFLRAVESMESFLRLAN